MCSKQVPHLGFLGVFNSLMMGAAFLAIPLSDNDAFEFVEC
jgi:hypothetical protein